MALLLNPERRLASYHLTSSLLGIAFAAIVLWLLRCDHLQVLLGAFWIGVSALVLLLGLWPGLLDGLAAMAGISYSPALLLLIAVLVLLIKALHADIASTRLERQIRTLNQRLAVLQVSAAREMPPPVQQGDDSVPR